MKQKNDATLDVIHDLSAASDDFKIEENEEKVLLLTSELEQVDDEIRKGFTYRSTESAGLPLLKSSGKCWSVNSRTWRTFFQMAPAKILDQQFVG